MTPAERKKLIRQYAEGPAKLKAALAEVPKEALQWRPGPRKWSVHEVIVHCADSEVQAHTRIRKLLVEPDALIQGYDQDRWAAAMDYHQLPIGPALAAVEAVRGSTVPLLERMTEADWQKAGRHTEAGSYSAEKWLQVYAIHLDMEKHAGQIRRNVEGWKKVSGKR